MSLATLWRGKLQLPSKGPGAARVFHVCVADLPFMCTSWCGDPWQRSGAFHRAQKRLFAIRSVARKRGELGALATGCVKGGPVGAGPPFQFQSIIGCPSDGSGDLTLSVVATIVAMTASLDERSSLFSWSIISIMAAGSQISRGRKPS